MEREQLAQCPYDRSHLIRVSRLPYHLVKCQRNNPQVARTLATCPFNATHRVPRAELQSHVASCPNKFQLDLPDEMSASIGNRMKQTEVPTTWQPPPCQEDWEAELENLEDAPPFILNIKPNNPLLPCHSSAPSAPVNLSRAGRVWVRGDHPRPPAPPPRRELRRSSEEASDLGRAVSCVLRTVPTTASQHFAGSFFLGGGWIQPAHGDPSLPPRFGSRPRRVSPPRPSTGGRILPHCGHLLGSSPAPRGDGGGGCVLVAAGN